MHPIIYDVAVSMDGYIAGPAGDISRFAHEGPVVEDYQQRLSGYSMAIMGRHTYEFGYRFGMQPGRNPYAHMRTIVCSASIALPEEREVEICKHVSPDIIRSLCREARGPVYLCGGGRFAASLLAMGLVDRLRLKRAPVLLGSGTPLFADQPDPVDLKLLDTRIYDDGYVFQEFDVK